MRTKRAFKMKWKAFLIIFWRAIINFFVRWESDFKLSITICLTSNFFFKKSISSPRNLSKQCVDLFKWAFSIFFGGYEVVECHDDVKVEYFSKCFLALYSNFQYLCLPSQLFEGKKMFRFSIMIFHYLSSHPLHYCYYQ